MRLPRERRIRASADFSRLRQNGSRLDCGPFLLNLGQGRSPETKARFAVVVAKKSIPLAVNRNRAKRLARELFRNDANLLPDGWECVLIARPSILRKSFASLVKIYSTAIKSTVK
jgi:ribonuclease P protein component